MDESRSGFNFDSSESVNPRHSHKKKLKKGKTEIEKPTSYFLLNGKIARKFPPNIEMRWG